MTTKSVFVKILMLISFLATVIVIWSFAIYSSKSNIQNNLKTTQTQSSTESSLSSSSRIKSSAKLSSSVISSSSQIKSSLRSSSVSSVISSTSLGYPILDNNLELVNDIKLIIERPNLDVQAKIKEAQSRPKPEPKTIVIESSIAKTHDNTDNIQVQTIPN